MVTLDLTSRALDLIRTHSIDAVKPRVAQLATSATVPPVVLQILAPVCAHGLACRAHALAVLAELDWVVQVAVLATLSAVCLVCFEVL